jgi:hypothetical protein
VTRRRWLIWFAPIGTTTGRSLVGIPQLTGHLE